MAHINVYCDESNHLENAGFNFMVLGAVHCLTDKRSSISQRIRDLKLKHNLSKDFEIKWTKISPAKTSFYTDLVDYFYDDDDLGFRAVIADKDTLDHASRGQTHDDWYYRMYYQLLTVLMNPQNKYFIYLDIKDTKGADKVQKLHQVLKNKMYDFDQQIIKRVQQVRSDEVEILQLTDLLTGAIQGVQRGVMTNTAKNKVIERIKERSGYNLDRTTLPSEPKTNLFYWQGS